MHLCTHHELIFACPFQVDIGISQYTTTADDSNLLGSRSLNAQQLHPVSFSHNIIIPHTGSGVSAAAILPAGSLRVQVGAENEAAAAAPATTAAAPAASGPAPPLVIPPPAGVLRAETARELALALLGPRIRRDPAEDDPRRLRTQDMMAELFKSDDSE